MTPAIQTLDPERDFGAIAALVRPLITDPPLTDAELRASFAAAMPLRRLTGIRADCGMLAGYCTLTRQASAPEGTGTIWIGVLPGARRQGIGGALYRDARAAARGYGLTQLSVRIDDDASDSLAFAERRGFQEQRHLVRQALDLGSFDPAPFAAALERAHAAGVRFTSLAELGDTPAARHQVYAINKATSADIPDRGPFYTYAEYEAQRFGHLNFRAAGILGALEGATWVGLAQVTVDDATRTANNQMTGVLRSHRGQGLALALKLHALRFAQSAGCVRIETFNDHNNPPILRLNHALGYRPVGGVRLLQAAIATADGTGTD